MRKNKMMRAASALLVAVLLTTSTISGTFAKYVTTSEAKDEARVAKWGVELQVVGNLFGDTYIDEIVKDDNANLTVQSVDKTADVVAPGTENAEGFTFSLKGKPEVDGVVVLNDLSVRNIFLKEGTYGVMIPVTNVVTEANYSEFFEKDGYDKIIVQLYFKNAAGKFEAADKDTWVADREYYTLEDEVTTANYYPVIFAMNGGSASTNYNIGTTSEDSLLAIAKIIAGKLGFTGDPTTTDLLHTFVKNDGIKFEANTDLAATAFNLDDKVITWRWAFGDADPNVISDSDKADTILGMLENTSEGTVVKLNGVIWEEPEEYTDYCLEVQLALDITVSQVN